MPWRLRTGAPWRDLPERFGPWQTVYERFARWETDGTWARLLEEVWVRGRHTSPRRRASSRNCSPVSVTVRVWLTRSRAAIGSDTSLGGRRPRSFGRCEATRTP